jgi:hypothetical protein
MNTDEKSRMNDPLTANSDELQESKDAQEDKRLNPRFPLRAFAEMQYSTKKWEANVLDLSVTGARLALLGEHLLRKGDALRVQILLDSLELNSTKKQLNLHGSLVHVREHILGYRFQPDTPADKELLEQLILFLAIPQ